MAKKFGITFNRWSGMGRVVDDPQFTDGWVRFYFKTLVPENNNGVWEEVENVIPLMSNNPKTIKTINDFVKKERQLYVEGYIKGWSNGQDYHCGVMVVSLKLGGMFMYDSEAKEAGGNNEANQNNGMPNFPS